jgi:hypothetical protein
MDFGFAQLFLAHDARSLPARTRRRMRRAPQSATECGKIPAFDRIPMAERIRGGTTFRSNRII